MIGNVEAGRGRDALTEGFGAKVGVVGAGRARVIVPVDGPLRAVMTLEALVGSNKVILINDRGVIAEVTSWAFDALLLHLVELEEARVACNGHGRFHRAVLANITEGCRVGGPGVCAVRSHTSFAIVALLAVSLRHKRRVEFSSSRAIEHDDGVGVFTSIRGSAVSDLGRFSYIMVGTLVAR